MTNKSKSVPFVTDEGIGSFLYLFPGDAEQDKDNPLRYTYKIELSGDICNPGSELVQAVTQVAKENDPQNWQRHVFGPAGICKKLEEYPTRTLSKYDYAKGKYVIGFSKHIKPATFKMDPASLVDPTQRALYEQRVRGEAPKIRKFANPNNPADVAAIQLENQNRVLRGMQVVTEADYAKARIDVTRGEIWAGCYFKVVGHAWWEGVYKKRVAVSLDLVLFTREGPRIVAARDAESALDAFAPASEMAPQPVSAGASTPAASGAIDWSKA